MKKSISRKTIFKDAGVLLIAIILVLTSIVIVTMTKAQTPQHDVGVSNIIAPFSGCLTTYPVNVTIRNYGVNTETFDVQVEIIKPGTEEISKVEDFSTWPPAYWTYSGYVSSPTSNAGGTSPEAAYTYPPYVSYGWLMTPTIDVSGCCKIILEFNLTGYFSTYYDPNLYVTWTNDGGANWHDVTPWDNPISGNLEPERYSIDICCGCGGCGNNFQVRWYFDNYYYYLQYGSGIYLDDVTIKGYASYAEYADLVEHVTIPPYEEVVVNFSYWTPSGCDEYCVTAFTILEGDEDSSNDCKTVNISISCDFELEYVINMIEDLKKDVDDLGKPFGDGLKAKLDAAIGKLIDNPPKIGTAINEIKAFINQVGGKRGNGLTDAEADALHYAATQIIWLLDNCFDT